MRLLPTYFSLGWLLAVCSLNVKTADSAGPSASSAARCVAAFRSSAEQVAPLSPILSLLPEVCLRLTSGPSQPHFSYLCVQKSLKRARMSGVGGSGKNHGREQDVDMTQMRHFWVFQTKGKFLQIYGQLPRNPCSLEPCF